MDDLLKNPAMERRGNAVYDALSASFGHAVDDKGKLKMPAGSLPVMNALVQPTSRDNLTIKACFFGQCRSGTLSRLN